MQQDALYICLLSAIKKLMQEKKLFSYPGFTLIELLVVIAVVGVLAGAVVVIINPAEQLARSRDVSRKSAIIQLGKALESYNVTSGQFPPPGTQAVPTWMQSLVASNDLRTALPLIQNSASAVCWADASAFQTGQNNYCYVRSTTTYAWTNLESKAELAKCGAGATASNTFYVYDSSLGKACIKCSALYNGGCSATQ